MKPGTKRYDQLINFQLEFEYTAVTFSSIDSGGKMTERKGNGLRLLPVEYASLAQYP